MYFHLVVLFIRPTLWLRKAAHREILLIRRVLESLVRDDLTTRPIKHLEHLSPQESSGNFPPQPSPRISL